MLSSEEKRFLLASARCSLEARVRGKPERKPVDSPPALQKWCGAFVTLHKQGELRGCIGYVEGLKPLAETVAELAGRAALEDPRFVPVSEAELPDIEIEISVLSSLTRASGPGDITTGIHGLLIIRGDRRGLLLPQVSVEQGWDVETFLSHAARKAGLSAEAWRDPATEIHTFTAQVFGERTPESLESADH